MPLQKDEDLKKSGLSMSELITITELITIFHFAAASRILKPNITFITYVSSFTDFKHWNK